MTRKRKVMYPMLVRLNIYDPPLPCNVFLNGLGQKSLAGFPGSRDELLGDFLRRAEVMQVYKAIPYLAAHHWRSSVLEMMGVSKPKGL